MIEFINALSDPDNEFLRLALYVGTLASLSFGIIGSYVVTRRISYLAGAISHCVFGGIGAGLYIQNKVGLEWFDPMYGAVISAILAAVIIGTVSLHAQQREDTVIGALWAIGMATGLLFIDRTPGYFDMSSYLFGDILLISNIDLQLVVILDIIVVGFTVFFYNKLLAVCFDDEFARLRGINAGAFYMLLLCLTALTVVLLVRVVGIVMVIALLTIPAAVAGQFAKRLWQMMLLAIFFCMLFTWTGLAVSYSYRLSSGPTIIVIAGLVYLIVLLFTRIIKTR
ncbi:MAG: metal ABC transporter permease [Desulfobacterales bacterium]|nr:metal ABC transporter permease [Desulfobacteraceae bacterium]MBT4363657.1 metal ABC transporter permease [Desulfobacteraceae bacterium]MBT7087181.1 metal ABC transporter permease [Desulfobacterales bacterium]MBT7697265.1 metal ABC transporter permease [Desulfobacterales bacterium]